MDVHVGYAIVHVSDLARAVAFYHDALGLPLLLRADEFRFARLDAGPIWLGVAGIDPKDASFAALVGRHTGIGFAVPDVDAAYGTLCAKGVRFPMVPSDQPWGGRLALFADPDGNVFYLDRAAATAAAVAGAA